MGELAVECSFVTFKLIGSNWLYFLELLREESIVLLLFTFFSEVRNDNIQQNKFSCNNLVK